MKEINKDNRIFQSSDFQKDRYKFNIILKNLPSPTLELYSDEENYIICRGSKEYPTWIWTKDNFDKSKLPEIEQLMEMYLTDKEKDKFTCKKELYEELIKDSFEYLNKDDYFEMGFLVCYKTKPPRNTQGIMSLIQEEDRKTVEDYWYSNCLEMDWSQKITKEQAKKEVEEFIASGTFYVLKNNEKIVSMGGYGITDNQAKITHVYTPKEERGKGYAANLIYQMTNILLQKGLVPLLYTDYNYIPSNKAYTNVGYEDTGILINFSCSKRIKNIRL